MAKTIDLYSLAAPTGLTLSLVAGGSLLPNTTYYYQIFAVEYKFGVAVFSPRTATVFITTDSTKKSIKLDWTGITGYSPTNAENNCYHILHNTSDSFLDTDACLMMSSAIDTVSKRIYSGVTFTDTGTNHVDHYIPIYKGGLPVIYVTTAADEWVSMWEIYQADHAANLPKLTQAEGIGFRFATNQFVTEPTVTYSGYDIAWKTHYNGTVYDGTLLSRSQTDGKAWLYLGLSLGVGGSLTLLTFKNSFKIKISDKNDNLLEGASVVIKNAAGTTVSSRDTDADGKYNAGYLTNRVLSPTTKLNGITSRAAAHEDTHITGGYLTKADSNPHTITITQTGYQDYEDVITIDRKMDLEVALLTGIIGTLSINQRCAKEHVLQHR